VPLFRELRDLSKFAKIAGRVANIRTVISYSVGLVGVQQAKRGAR